MVFSSCRAETICGSAPLPHNSTFTEAYGRYRRWPMDEKPDDADRFTAMYDACRQRVWAYAAARAGQQAADEAVSETFAVAWRRIRDVPEPPLPWLLGVARNVLRESTRANRRWQSSATLCHPVGRTRLRRTSPSSSRSA
ncbi:RNA polymerase sigma factor [Streptomyces sp. LZ34]